MHLRLKTVITRRLIPRDAAALALAGVSTGAVATAHGGYFPTAWGWPVVAFASIILWEANTNTRLVVSGLELVAAAGMLALTVWFATSSVWGIGSSALATSFHALVYAAAVMAAIVVVRRTSTQGMLVGTLVGSAMISGYALATRLFPDRLGTFDSIAGYRLSTPLGYWNALGLLCAIGILLSLSLVSSASSPRRAALAALPAPVLLLAMYFTFSRGSWISLGAGLAVAVALDPKRLRLTAAAIAIGVPSALGLRIASHSIALTHEDVKIQAAAHDGHWLALVVLALVFATSLLAAAVDTLTSRITANGTLERAYTITIALAAMVGAASVLVHFGGPIGASQRTWDSFASPPPKAQPDLQKRLFSFSGNGRTDLWRAAWHEFETHPLIGGGGGSYETYWMQHRTTAQKVKNAHSLYLETFAELGIVGFVLLLLALGAPFVAGWRARRRPGIAVATGAYVCFLVGAGVDWDWQITAVTLAAIFIGVAVLASARTAEERRVSTKARYGILIGAVAIGAAGFVFLVGNLFLSRAASAADNGKWTTAARDAQRASDWLPWSTAPIDQLGQAQLGAGESAAARATFRKAIAKDPADWNLWFDLARASTGKAQADALAHATKLNPLSPEIAAFKSELGSQGGIGITVGT